MELPKLLLHSCCGPCSTAVVERIEEQFTTTLFYYNPNITDSLEYQKRLSNQVAFLEAYNQRPERKQRIQFIEGDYRPEEFYQAATGLEKEREGGLRCPECFRLRLTKTADLAKELGFQWFGTTLSVSPHKSYQTILKIGLELAEERGLQFLQEDFKKKAGYQRSIQLSKEYGLYRQSYCGCSFAR